MTAALIVGILAAAGTYLVLQRGIVRITLGFVLLGHAATTALLAAGGVARRDLAFVGAPGTPGDPLPQAFALTAIVISFGVTAFLLALAYRSRDTLGHDDVEAPDLEGSLLDQSASALELRIPTADEDAEPVDDAPGNREDGR
ncbi:MAG: NADH-quinone oxidoreductase subunit K [Nitriliruptor sp.]|uniref:sodium:proton antiporter n=1 Tax=Nitriliruptor sp. TaxID=2448056 RepID=UPI00349FD236